MRYRRTFLEEYEKLAGTDKNGPFGADFREDVGQFVINFISENGITPSNKLIIENCIPEQEIKRLKN